MKRILHATKDTYVTNKISRSGFRVIDANVGLAGTLDLFKLAGETTVQYVTASLSGSVLRLGNGPFVTGTDDAIELSRLLLKFDLDPLRELMSSSLDFTNSTVSSTFKCTLRLFDVFSGQPVPSNFEVIVYPLSKSFDEGIGRDVYAFQDLDACNFMSASIVNGAPVAWSTSSALALVQGGMGDSAIFGGASEIGYVGQSDIDVMSGSTILGDLFTTQQLVDGTEDLALDVTKIVSATLAGTLEDHGFRVSFTSDHELSDRTLFVKRFGSRHSTNFNIRPMIEVGYDDSVTDLHGSFYFNSTGSLFLKNSVRNILTNIQHTSGLTLTLMTGSVVSGTFYSASFPVTQKSTGIYEASVVLNDAATGSLFAEVEAAASATFTEIWHETDYSRGYYTGSLVVFSHNRSAFTNSSSPLKVNITNMKRSFKTTEIPRLRVFIQDDGYSFVRTRLPIEAQSLVYDDIHYRIRDVLTDELIFDFDTTFDSTKLSTDSSGMYFDVHMIDMHVGRTYCIDLMIVFNGVTTVYECVGNTFYVSGD